MEKKRIVLVGAGGHCKSCIEVIESIEGYEIYGIIDRLPSAEKILSYPILGDDNYIATLANQPYLFLITVGQIKSAAIRKRLYDNIKTNKGNFAIIQSHSSIVSKRSTLGEGTIVFSFAIINSGVSIGKNTIINNKALIEHDCAIGDHTHVSTGAIINGDCAIGSEVFIGSNAVVVQGVTIASNIIIGAGSVVTKNISEPGIYAGNPARKIAEIE